MIASPRDPATPTRCYTIPAGTIKRIHVNQHHIRSNKNEETKLPVLTVKTSKRNYKAFEVSIAGPSETVYSPDKPLSCGAHVWVETKAAVTVNHLVEDIDECAKEQLGE